ncbi:hypothetical protein RI367_006785 [Sorochytrium milnesiophthora]
MDVDIDEDRLADKLEDLLHTRRMPRGAFLPARDVPHVFQNQYNQPFPLHLLESSEDRGFLLENRPGRWHIHTRETRVDTAHGHRAMAPTTKAAFASAAEAGLEMDAKKPATDPRQPRSAPPSQPQWRKDDFLVGLDFQLPRTSTFASLPKGVTADVANFYRSVLFEDCAVTEAEYIILFGLLRDAFPSHRGGMNVAFDPQVLQALIDENILWKVPEPRLLEDGDDETMMARARAAPPQTMLVGWGDSRRLQAYRRERLMQERAEAQAAEERARQTERANELEDGMIVDTDLDNSNQRSESRQSDRLRARDPATSSISRTAKSSAPGRRTPPKHTVTVIDLTGLDSSDEEPEPEPQHDPEPDQPRMRHSLPSRPSRPGKRVIDDRSDDEVSKRPSPRHPPSAQEGNGGAHPSRASAPAFSADGAGASVFDDNDNGDVHPSRAHAPAFSSSATAAVDASHDNDDHGDIHPSRAHNRAFTASSTASMQVDADDNGDIHPSRAHNRAFTSSAPSQAEPAEDDNGDIHPSRAHNRAFTGGSRSASVGDRSSNSGRYPSPEPRSGGNTPPGGHHSSRHSDSGRRSDNWSNSRASHNGGDRDRQGYRSGSGNWGGSNGSSSGWVNSSANDDNGRGSESGLKPPPERLHNGNHHHHQNGNRWEDSGRGGGYGRGGGRGGGGGYGNWNNDRGNGNSGGYGSGYGNGGGGGGNRWSSFDNSSSSNNNNNNNNNNSATNGGSRSPVHNGWGASSSSDGWGSSWGASATTTNESANQRAASPVPAFEATDNWGAAPAPANDAAPRQATRAASPAAQSFGASSDLSSSAAAAWGSSATETSSSAPPHDSFSSTGRATSPPPAAWGNDSWGAASTQTAAPVSPLRSVTDGHKAGDTGEESGWNAFSSDENVVPAIALSSTSPAPTTTTTTTTAIDGAASTALAPQQPMTATPTPLTKRQQLIAQLDIAKYAKPADLTLARSGSIEPAPSTMNATNSAFQGLSLSTPLLLGGPVFGAAGGMGLTTTALPTWPSLSLSSGGAAGEEPTAPDSTSNPFAGSTTLAGSSNPFSSIMSQTLSSAPLSAVDSLQRESSQSQQPSPPPPLTGLSLLSNLGIKPHSNGGPPPPLFSLSGSGSGLLNTPSRSRGLGGGISERGGSFRPARGRTGSPPKGSGPPKRRFGQAAKSPTAG